jgi:hypothetical protein
LSIEISLSTFFLSPDRRGNDNNKGAKVLQAIFLQGPFPFKNSLEASPQFTPLFQLKFEIQISYYVLLHVNDSGLPRN